MNIATKIAESFVCDDYGDLYVIAESHEVDELKVLGNKFDDMLDLLKSTRNSLSFVSEGWDMLISDIDKVINS